ncbi:branched-chain amino acid ABC transporter permease [Paenibacillus sp. MB22_1]|jgi:branched-chain amino acid transport system permease protein|uniref:branched-chain amino acid ABC transporter permease n=1 Tax=Paenibacillus TaxID=44249 RepID=UPI0028FD1BE5|nr:branched-chain amino acid ABC transporter permease [Paenibacillus sp. 3LSP]MDU0332886.1 branched-chain amino acid ABC transporter permease [Paenibacillus sp. 3LSP]
MVYSADYIIQQLVNGLGLGSVYALIAIGYTLVYGILRLINFAHGDLLMIGSYAAMAFTLNLLLPFPVAILLSIAVTVMIGLVVERAAYRPLRSKPEETTLVTSFAVSILIQNLATMILSPQPRSFQVPSYLSNMVEVGNIDFSVMNIAIIGLSALLLIALTLFIKKTKLGIAMRATAENMNASVLMGVNINSIVRTAFIIGAGLAAVAGVMNAGRYGRIEPMMGFVPGLKAFVAAVIGGIGSLPGAAIGGLILGFGEILFVGFLPPELSAYKDAFVFLALIVVLLIKPTGIFGKAEDRRV